MMKKYNFQSVEDIPNDLVEYVETVSKQSIMELTLEEVNDFLNEGDKFLDDNLQWAWQDSGIEGGF